MNYHEFTELCKSKNIQIKDVCDFIGMTRPGLTKALDNETVELRKLKLLCDFVRISPAQFFDTGTFGIMHQSARPEGKKAEDYEKEIEMLKSQIADKNEIIALYREKGRPYGVVAEGMEKTELSKK